MPSEITNQDQQCQKILQNLTKMGVCSPQKAASIWQQWSLYRKSHQQVPAQQFFLYHGISEEQLKQAFHFSQLNTKPGATTAPLASPSSIPKSPELDTTSASQELQSSNNLLAAKIEQENLIRGELLNNVLLHCNQSLHNLGQTLVRNRHLQMSDLIRLLKEISQGERGDAPSEEGDVLQQGEFGNYKILGEIARGGMGVVYRAMDQARNEVVALKVLLSGASAGQGQVDRFFREVEATKALQHPNIVPVYDMGEVGGHHYFTMRFIEGVTLEDYIDEELPLKKKLRLFCRICQALHHAHQKKILHRDLKPSNILIDHNYVPYLTDFGLAKFVDGHSSLTQTGTAIGTPFYMSPEQVHGVKNKVNEQSDIYSLGVIFYQLLTKELPFSADNLTQLYKRICEEEPLPPKTRVPELASDLSAICMKSISKEQEGRYQSALALAEDIQKYISGTRVKRAHRVGLKTGWKRWNRRNQRNIVRASIMIPLILFVLATLFVIQKRGTDNRIEQTQVESQAKLTCLKAESLIQNQDYGKALALLSNLVESTSFYPAHILQAQIYIKLEKFELSLQCLNLAERQVQKSVKVLYYKALVYFKTGRENESLRLLSQALNDETNQASGEETWSEGYYLRAQVYRQIGQIENAKRDAQKADYIVKKDQEKTLSSIEKLIQEGEEGEALASLDSVISLFPKFARAHALKAQIYYQRKDLDQALNSISQAVELSSSMEYSLWRGDWLLEAGYLKEAVKTFEVALKQAKDDKEKMTILKKAGHAYFSLQELIKSSQIYQELLAKGIEDSEVYLNIGLIAFEQREYDRALGFLEKSYYSPEVSREEKSKSLFYQGYTLLLQKKYSLAISILEKSLIESPFDKGSIYRLLGEAHFHLDNLPKSKEYLSQAQVINPQDIKVLQTLARLYVKEEDYSPAIELFGKCIAQQPWISSHYEERGKCYGKLKKYELSREDYFKCLDLEPHNFDPLIKLLDEGFHGSVARQVKELLKWINIFIDSHQLENHPNLFEEELENAATLYIQKSLHSPTKKVKPLPWDAKRVDIFLQALVNSDSTAVISMAQTSLISFHQHSELVPLLEEKIAQGRTPGALRNLKEALALVEQKKLEKKKILLRQLLFRYYQGRDNKALEDLYRLIPDSLIGLKEILYSSENSQVQFLAGLALRDLCLPEAQEILEEATLAKDSNVKVFATVVLLAKGFTDTSRKALREAIRLEDPFVRALAARYLTLKEEEDLELFLQDKDTRVQLYAAEQLWKYGNSVAGEIMAQHFNHSDSLIRSYCQSVFWDFSVWEKNLSSQAQQSLKKTCLQRYLPELMRATADITFSTRQIAILRLEPFLDRFDVREAIRKCVKDRNQQVRFQAITVLSRNGGIEFTLPIALDSSEPLIFRAASFIGGYAGAQKLNAGMAFKLFNLVEDADFRLRVLILALFEDQGKETGAIFLHSLLSNPDPYMKVGALSGLLGQEQSYMLPTLKKLLKDENRMVREAVVANLVYLYEANPKKLPSFPKIIQRYDYLGKAAATAYAWPLYNTHYYKTVVRRRQNFSTIWNQEAHYNEFIHMIVENLRKRKKRKELQIKYLRYFEKAVKLDPDNIDYHFEKGILHFLQKEYEKSIFFIEMALEKRPHFSVYKHWLALAYTEMKQDKKALSIIEEVLQEKPWKKESLHLQEQILWRLGMKEEAEKSRQRAKLIEINVK